MNATATAADNNNKPSPSPPLLTNQTSQFCYSIIAGLSGVVIGTAIGWNSPVTQLLTKSCHMVDTSGSGGGDLDVWKIAGYYCLGTVIGGLVQGLLAKSIGYRWSTMAFDSATLIGWLVLLEIDDFPNWQHTIMVGRFVQGFGTGGLSLLTPTYISHITDFGIRGRAQVFHQVYVYFGVFYSYVFGAIMTYATLISVCMVWPVFHLLVTLFFLPESPCYLYARNKYERLKTVLRRIKGPAYDADSDYGEFEKYMERGFNMSSCDSASTNATSRKRGDYHVFAIGLALMVFQQLCGANLCIFYMERLFNEFGSLDDMSIKTRVAVLTVSLVQVLLCLIPIELVEFLGRRYMLIVSATGMGLSMVTTLYYAGSVDDVAFDRTDWRDNRIVILMAIYVCSYSVGWGAVVMLLYTELVHFDKWFSSLVYASGQIVVFLLVYTFSNSHALKNAYLTCTCISSCVMSIVFVYYFVPETRGLHLNQIQTVLDNRLRIQDERENDGNLREVNVDK